MYKRIAFVLLFLYSSVVFGANSKIISTAVTSVNQDSKYTYNLQASDADGDNLTWKVKDGTQLPSGITIDKEENLYVADTSNHRIRKITKNGEVTTIAGDEGSTSFSDAQTIITIVDCNTSTFTPIQTDDVLVKDTKITNVTIVHNSNNTKKVCVNIGKAHLVRE